MIVREISTLLQSSFTFWLHLWKEVPAEKLKICKVSDLAHQFWQKGIENSEKPISIDEMGFRDECRIYVGNLPPDIRERELDDLFYKYGQISNIDLKVRRGPPFAFIEFEDPRDAEDAVDRRDGYNYDGYKLRVEFPRGNRRGSGDDYYRGSYSSSYGYGASSSSGSGSSRSRAPPRRSSNRVYVTGLPFSGSWQDLKDHLREAGEVCFADVFKDGTGVAEFVHREDMRYAIRKLDDTKFRSHEGDSSYIRIREDNGNRSMSRSRSRSRSLSYSGSRSRSLTPRSRSRSPSRSISSRSRDFDD